MEDGVTSLPFHRVERVEVIRVAVLGIIVGILIPLLGNAISMWVIEPIFCNDANNFAVCASGGLIAYYVAASLITVMAVGLLVNWGVFRPLIIALGALVALWGLKKFIDPMVGANFIEYLLVSATLFGASYLLFYWMLRLHHFGISLALVVLIAAAIRWALLI